ncbi:MAG: PorT family protein, partial [Muribaculaceae bacterium]|nr:PorT family protein [Muribaculaceae bacterium]
MKLSRRILIAALVGLMTVGAQAQEFTKGKPIIKARLGYNLGGTMPLGMPASIRKLNSYSLQMAPAVGANVLLPIDASRGIQLGLLFENKAM